jgi:beta-fructofuranosidase
MDIKRRAFLKNAAATTLLNRFSAAAASANVSHSSEGGQTEVSPAMAPDADSRLFYAPKEGRVGDVIPFYDGKRFRVFHLYRADHDRGGTTWQQVSTSDFVNFTELGTMLPRGTPEEQDLSVATGSVTKGPSGQYHIFYTGYNTPQKGRKPEQGIMHAISEDLVHWKKVPEDTFYAPTDLYEPDDWRDPFVFWNEEANEYWLLVAARRNTGPRRRRGCTALCVSKDLKHWEVRKPFWAPGLYFTHECPDLFRMGDWWYLIFSEFSEGSQTRYRMSRDLAGPWLAPGDDVFDCRAFYAAKTATDGKRRFLFGWNPRRAGQKDDGKWEWGGNLVVHELLQRANGELYVTIPKSIEDAFTQREPLAMRAALGQSELSTNRVKLKNPQTLGIATLGRMSTPCKISTTLEFAAGTRAFGLMFKVVDDLDSCYYLRFEPARGRMVLDLWPRPGDVPFMTGFERPLKLRPGEPLLVQVVMDGTITEIYAGNSVAMSTRMYRQPGELAAFVDEGVATFGDLRVLAMAGNSATLSSCERRERGIFET